MADRYRKEVGRLVAALNDPAHRTEAPTVIRDLVERIVLTPNDGRTELMIDLHGDLAGILTVAHGKPPHVGAKGIKPLKKLASDQLEGMIGYVRGKLVAGAGFEPAAFRL